MADTNNYIVTAPNGTLTGSRTLVATGGLFTTDSGAEGQVTISTTGHLSALDTFGTGGYIAYDTNLNTFVPRTFIEGTGITITEPSGATGNSTISVDESSIVQLVNIQADTVDPIYTGSTLNFVGTGGTTVTVGTNVPNNSIDVTVTSSNTEAPGTAKYIVQTADGSLPNAQSLGTLTTGLVKVTSDDTTGILSTASPTADYLPYNTKLAAIGAMPATTGDIIVGASGAFNSLSVGAAGKFLGTSDGVNLAYLTPPTGSTDTVILPADTATVFLENNTTYIVPNTTVTTGFQLNNFITPGDYCQIIGYSPQTSAGGWRVTSSGETQTIRVGTTDSSGSGGSVSSTLGTDSIDLYCKDADHYIARVFSGQLNVI